MAREYHESSLPAPNVVLRCIRDSDRGWDATWLRALPDKTPAEPAGWPQELERCYREGRGQHRRLRAQRHAESGHPVAIACRPGAVFVDVDARDLAECVRASHPDAWFDPSPRGAHFGFRVEDGLRIASKRVRPGIDLKAAPFASYVVVYAPVRPLPPVERLPLLPADLLEPVQAARPASATGLWLRGERNKQLFAALCALRARGVNERALLAVAHALATHQIEGDLERGEVEHVAHNAAKYAFLRGFRGRAA